MKAVALIMLASLALAGLVQADVPPAGTNCHRSCYTLDLGPALRLKQSYYKACGVTRSVTVQKTMRGNPKSKNKAASNAYGCGSLIQYKFKTNADLVKYQGCEHTLSTYIKQLQPYKKSLPKSILRDFKC